MKSRFLIVGVVIALSVVALVYSTGTGGTHTLVVVDTRDVAKDLSKYDGKELRVRGFVKTGSIVRYGDRADFVVTQDGSTLPVHFTGNTQLPDAFADGSPVRIDGKLSADGRLQATKVEAKCASKYDAKYASQAEAYGYAPHATPVDGAGAVNL